MEYDESYQNEQAHSPAFQLHLQKTLLVVKDIIAPGSRVIEVGCGKGVFLSMLRDAGFGVTGYDPAHEAGDPDVIQRYFLAGLDIVPGQLIVLRHTLEHMPDPVAFLRSIRDANGGGGQILIEVPCFDWTLSKTAFWDISHEHCSYFTARVFEDLFGKVKIEHCFGEQYIWVVADLASLHDDIVPGGGGQAVGNVFHHEIGRLRSYVRERSGCLVWGAGAKGVAFANLIDPENEAIRGIIDINPKKQGKFIAKTGHEIHPPSALRGLGGGDIIIMNEIYTEEIMAMSTGCPNLFLTVGGI
ncbi:class I SAM-dependent methyltransferase [Pseudodesulfovibrio pelocollis]|uniref:class I SAM-dependent methyltransferase n=1 Tax=Pseudodesulfovibrio pelocollis TaxID=3051432 RepID=UPI00255A8A93|nr:class I SAM-dependent methyltransferase [Pseudodesulfovibrio sp. SB368]